MAPPSLAYALALATPLALAAPLMAQVSDDALPAAARALTLALPSLERLRFDTSGSPPGAHQAYDLAWRHPAFTLRARVSPAGDPAAHAPAVSAGATATHCARNGDGDEAEDYVGRWRAGAEDLARLNAEWAYFFDYAPKPAFSRRRRCYQASYYREGVGLVHAWLLYDDPEYLHSEWAYALPFAADAGEGRR